ncbi:ABC transporter substrate-binding protein [Stenotrophomonas maltophilia]|uniref:ABC transporter substrate-binding protein n=1 Tax=Stenotrophomonas TaxID=40323 RepID=UPI00066B0B90|nr:MULTISPECIES: ABC transporter substrate-binding protein [Stenotrophomonas]MBH1838639.1 ABC transporter substrate-binding protein [Stenotrophomonas maltophilia]MCI1065658.1 ABC transporter substrate-binding protein [Stenotrophomonas maltophilia]MCI1106778.1 ABC transporter substrate-binding protein [Stenotrophomonas maltophilia]MCU1050740.1 ABC transporter substrate-binding protein [Stenotrophomonas maltophilia]MDH0186326.1 ABC transporter substrate-binding protein [Stenotrophomonas sp. GD04
MYKQFLMAALCAAGLAAAGCSNSGRTEGASAGGGDNAPVRISVGSYNLNNLPFFIADAKGYFKDVGLEVKTENFAQGGSKVLQALVANSTDVAVGFYDHTIQMQAKGKDVVAFVLLSRNSGLVMAGREDATFDPARPETIKGQKVGITAPGSSSDFFVRHFLAQHDIPADSISLIGVGSGAAAVAALEQGKIDLLVNYDPAATLITERKVGKILLDARSDDGARQVYGGLYPTSVMYANQSFLDKRPEAAAKIARAEQMALKFIADNSAEEIVAALPDSYVSGDRATYARAVENARAIFTRDGHFTPADLETPLKVLREFNTDVAKANIDLSRTYTNAFVERANAAAPAAQP